MRHDHQPAAHGHRHDPDNHHDEPHDHGWRDPHQAPGPSSILDIGGDIGAITVRLADDTATGELMACPRGRPADHFHTGVHLRPVGDTEGWVAVFPALPEGDYSLLTDDGREYSPLSVVGGKVTSLSFVDRHVVAG